MVLVSAWLLCMVMVSVCMVAGHGVGVELTNVKLRAFLPDTFLPPVWEVN